MSPALTGTPTAPTATADTNTTQLATTEFVIGQAATAAPIVDGTAVVGTSKKYARQDHAHPTDTTRLAAAAYTAADVLAKLLTVDTDTSGLNATTVKGYVPVNKAGDTMTGALLAPNLYSRRAMPGTDLNTVIAPGIYLLGTNSTYANGAGMDYCVLEVHSTDDTGYIVQKATQVVSPFISKYRMRIETAGGWGAWQQQWADGNAPKSLASSGYQKLPSGLIIQWGLASNITIGNPGLLTSVNFPISFPTACLAVTSNAISNAWTNNANTSTTSFQVSASHPTVTSNTSVFFTAIGY